jgi:hypothetical protein
MKNGFPYWQFHNERWLTGKVASFDLEAQGLFLQFCMAAWAGHGPFNICHTSIRLRFRKTAEWVAETVAAMLEVGILMRDGDQYRIKFIDAQFAAVTDTSDKRKAAGRASFIARRAPEHLTDIQEESNKSNKSNNGVEHMFNTCSTPVQHVFNTCSTCVDQTSAAHAEAKHKKPKAARTTYPADFEAVWWSYGRYGSKPRAAAYWSRLTPDDRQAIAAAIEPYLRCVAAGRAKKQLEGWINPENRLWEMEWPAVLAELTKPLPARPVERRSWNDIGTGGL